MQGQRSAIGSLPDSINIDYGSSLSNVGIDEEIIWNNFRNSSDAYSGNADHERQSLRRLSFNELSSSNPENQLSHGAQMAHNGWPPSINISTGDSLRLEEQRYEPTNLVSQANVDLNLSSNQVTVGPVFLHSSDHGSASQININERQCHRVGNNMDYPTSSKPLGFESKLITSASSSSDPCASSSGSGGFIMEEDEGRPGCSLDGRRLSCKRKTLEGNGGQPSSSDGFFPRVEGGVWHAVPPQYNAGNNVNVSARAESSSISPPVQVNPRLGLGLGGGVSADSFRSRSNRFRINMSDQLDSMPSNPFLSVATGADRHPDIPPANQSLRFVNPSLDLMSPIPPDNLFQQNPSVTLPVPTLRRNMQSSRWNGEPNLRPRNSSSSSVAVERDSALPEDLNPRNVSRNITDHLILVPPVDGRSSAQNVTNWSLSSVDIGISRNAASSSRTVTNLGSQHSSGRSWGSYNHPPSQYSRRLSEYVRRSLLSTVASENAGQIGNNNQHRSGLASSQESIIPPVDRNDVQSQSHSRAAAWVERQGDGAIGLPYSLRALAAAGEGRSRLVSEIRNVLDIMRRGERLRFEDVMILDRSFFSGMADIHDQHRDMRLDVDNMSYEELLALEERIGNVCTGLSEETILRKMKQRKFIHAINAQIDAEPCCICQETYNNGEDLGILDCGHDFHSDCIKQWLAQKNLCPICKTTALGT